MMKWIKEHKDIVLYFIFGVVNTVVNFIAFKIFDVLFEGKYYLLTNGIAWFISFIFAYLVNKWWERMFYIRNSE